MISQSRLPILVSPLIDFSESLLFNIVIDATELPTLAQALVLALNSPGANGRMGDFGQNLPLAALTKSLSHSCF
jgi:hypothetical protein